MRQVRQDLARRGIARATAYTRALQLDELLRLDDEAFIDRAYRTILRRAPDHDGTRSHLEALKNGISKLDILFGLRFSDEGRRHGVSIGEPLVLGAVASEPPRHREPTLPRQDRYALGDFLQFDDVDFVVVGYRTLLRRTADAAGLRAYLDALRSGALSKVEVLGSIRFSKEGRRCGVPVAGLARRYRLRRWRRRRGGWLIGFAMALASLPRLVPYMERIAARAAWSDHTLRNLVDTNDADNRAAVAKLAAAARWQRAEVNEAGQRERARVDRAISEMMEAVNGKGDRARRALAVSLQDAIVSEGSSRKEAVAKLHQDISALMSAFEDDRGTRTRAQAALADELRSSIDSEARSRNRAVEELRAGVDATAASFEAYREEMARVHTGLAAEVRACTDAATRIHEEFEELEAHFRACDTDGQRARSELSELIREHGRGLDQLGGRVDQVQQRFTAMLSRLAATVDRMSSQRAGGASQQGSRQAPWKPALASHYAEFEKQFRGDPACIRLRVAHYLETLASAGIAPGDSGVILDLGSGRGELLDVLSAHGYRARGVDTNVEMLAGSIAASRDVVNEDALAYLRAQEAGSYAAITSLHMIEHIPYASMLELIDEALRVLRPGGLLILETPNPENPLVGSCRFYYDPTHLRPIPPLLLKWTVTSRGFEFVSVDRLTDHRGPPEVSAVDGSVPGAEQLNRLISWFSTAQDYAVVARKPSNMVGLQLQESSRAHNTTKAG